MKVFHLTAFGAFCSLVVAADALAQWVTFENQTSTRLAITTPDATGDPAYPSDPMGQSTDTQEKDFAWGDFNNDGWIDLVSARKQPFTTPGRRRNLLLMNESGVLVDRTAQYATASDVPGDLGFYTRTNDRDIIVADVDGDTWLDLITAAAISPNQPKHISYPRIYRNLGNDERGQWLGFRFESDRIPIMVGAPLVNGNPAEPRFIAAAAGDVTGDGYADLYFSDSDNGLEPEAFDYNDRLLINRGAAQPGYFDDSGTTRMSAAMLLSAFGTSCAIADMNGDNAPDVIKCTTLNVPSYVGIVYNDPQNIGTFSALKQHFAGWVAYYVSVADLNNDGLIDMAVTVDGTDHYDLNVGNGHDGLANFNQTNFSGDDGFGDESIIADLDNDGWNDVLIADVYLDILGCARRMHIYHNLGNAPNVTIVEQPVGGLGNASANNSGTHTMAVFDINRDGWKDVVIGRCSGTFVWINVPPVLCAADIAPVGSLDGAVGPADLGQLLSSWGPCAGCAADLAPVAAPDGVVGPADLGQLLSGWGQCP